MKQNMWGLTCCLACWHTVVAFTLSPFDWPNVLGQAWLFDQGSTHGFRSEPGAMRGPAPDWALAGRIPLVGYGIDRDPRSASEPLTASSYPGAIVLDGNVKSGGAELRVQACLIFHSSNTAIVRLSVQNHGSQTTQVRFRITASDINVTSAWRANSIGFALPESNFPCLCEEGSSRGSFHFATTCLNNGTQQDLSWNHTLEQDRLAVTSSEIFVQRHGEASAFISVSFPPNPTTVGADAHMLNSMVNSTLLRWSSYLRTVLSPLVQSPGMRWVAVKSVMTLLNNWRLVPGLPDGVLPSYNGYESGFWSWDTYKQAVGMVDFAPQLAKDQLRLIVSAQNKQTGHIPDKVDRCGKAGGCSGKPPLLAWAVWQIFEATRDFSFLQEMYDATKQFHYFWYSARDVKGVGLCSWTEGMESGMDDGVRFLPQYASSISNASSRVTTLDFWSIDLNSYLYKDKLTLFAMADALGMVQEARDWKAAAEALLPKLRQTFFVPDGRAGFFSDVYFNGTALPIEGCEGYAALFAGVANLSQAAQVADTLRDPGKFFLNFSLPSVSKQNAFYNPHGYWKGPTWLDQTWFAYSGLRSYAAEARRRGDEDSEATFSHLASVLKSRVFERGRGFSDKDQTPLNEHYNPETGDPEGAQHFSWTAAHTLMWTSEGHAVEEQEIWT
ncbi:ygjK [Symbiodinium sp. CCMP2592]|nr:ygjK [Symbiodinium sp. CCMP2592]